MMMEYALHLASESPVAGFHTKYFCLDVPVLRGLVPKVPSFFPLN